MSGPGGSGRADDNQGLRPGHPASRCVQQQHTWVLISDTQTSPPLSWHTFWPKESREGQQLSKQRCQSLNALGTHWLLPKPWNKSSLIQLPSTPQLGLPGADSTLRGMVMEGRMSGQHVAVPARGLATSPLRCWRMVSARSAMRSTVSLCQPVPLPPPKSGQAYS